MVPWTQTYWDVLDILQTAYYEAGMQPARLGAMLRATLHKTSAWATGYGPRQLKKLVQLPEIKVMETSTSKPQILSVTHALDATACAIHLRIKIQLSRVTIAMIDLGATKNFMFTEFARKNQILGVKKDDLYQLTVVDGTHLSQNKRMVKTKTPPLRCQIQGKDLGQAIFDLVSIPQDVILRMPWLKKVNLRIDWMLKKVIFKKKDTLRKTWAPEREGAQRVKICKILPKQMRRLQQQKPQKVFTA